MTNEWNDFADSLVNAGSNVAQGFIVKGIRKDAADTYRKAMKNIDNIISMSPSGQEQTTTEQQPKEGDMLTEFFGGFNKEAPLQDNIAGMQSIGSGQMQQGPVIKPRVTQGREQGSTMNPEDELLKIFLDARAKLGGYGEYGQPYIQPLETYTKSKMPKQVKQKTEISNGYLIVYNDNGEISKKTKIDDLPPKEKNTVQKYSKMSLEEAEQLTENELTGDAFFYLPEAVRTELMKKYPVLQQVHDSKFKEGDFANNIKTGRKIGFKNSPVTFDQKDDKKKFDNLGDFNDRIRSGEQLTPEEEEKYNVLRLSLGDDYGLNDTQLAVVIDKLGSATNENQRTAILKELNEGKYHVDANTSQEQMDYDRNRILEWQTALNDAYNANDGSYDGYKQSFLKELDDFMNRGSITNKEYGDLKKMYY